MEFDTCVDCNRPKRYGIYCATHAMHQIVKWAGEGAEGRERTGPELKKAIGWDDPDLTTEKR